jgi:hypothetical protein
MTFYNLTALKKKLLCSLLFRIYFQIWLYSKICSYLFNPQINLDGNYGNDGELPSVHPVPSEWGGNGENSNLIEMRTTALYQLMGMFGQTKQQCILCVHMSSLFNLYIVTVSTQPQLKLRLTNFDFSIFQNHNIHNTIYKTNQKTI